MIKYILYLIPCKMWYSCSSLIVHSLYFSSFAISFTHRNRTWHKSFTHLRTAKYSTRRPTRQKGPFFTSWFRKISSDFFLKKYVYCQHLKHLELGTLGMHTFSLGISLLHPLSLCVPPVPHLIMAFCAMAIWKGGIFVEDYLLKVFWVRQLVYGLMMTSASTFRQPMRTKIWKY